MANPYVNKVIVNDQIKLDLTGDTVTAETLMQGYTAHDASGAPIVGTASGGGPGGEYNIISIDNGDGTQDIQITDAEGALIIQRFYTGSTAPTAAQGNDGDIYLKVVT